MATIWVGKSLSLLSFNNPSSLGKSFSLPCPFCPFPRDAPPPKLLFQAKRGGGRHLPPEPVLNQLQVGEDEEEEDEYFNDDDIEDFDDAAFMDDIDDDSFENEEDQELAVGDGREGGGVVFAGTSWDKVALALAEKVSLSFDSNLKIYAFRTTSNSIIQVRIENLSNKYGSPTMADIEDFSSAYRTLLDEAEQSGKVPDNISVEVSSPGLERIVRIPQDLERFKDLPLYVKYVTEVGSTKETDGVFKLVSFDLESRCCTWALANVRKNREQAGKGRPLSKKQKEWRLQTPFDCLRMVRRYSEF